MTAIATRQPDQAAPAAPVPDDLLARPWFTTAEIAQLLKVSPDTVLNWIEAGLPALRTGRNRGRYRLLREDVDAFLQDRYQRGSGRSGSCSPPSSTDDAL